MDRMGEKILVISPVWLFPGHSGNRKRIKNICAELMKTGYSVDYFYVGYEEYMDSAHVAFFNGEILDYRVDDQKLQFKNRPVLRIKELWNGLNIKTDRWKRRLADGPDSARYNKSLSEYKNLRKLELLKVQLKEQRYKAVIVNYAVYSFYFDLFDPETLKILDTHDLLTDRYKLYFDEDEEPVNWHSLRFEDEKRAVNKADVVWAITGGEHQHYATMTASGTTEVKTLRHITPFNRISAENSGKELLLIGSDNKLNIDGLAWFLDSVWPELRRIHPDAELIVAGSICKAQSSFGEVDGVRFYGKYDTQTEIYSKSDICINPMLHGTGLKIKTLEALSHGKIVMTTSAGASGLSDLIGQGLICSDSAETWIEELARFLKNPGQLSQQIDTLDQAITNIYRENVSVIKDSLS